MATVVNPNTVIISQHDCFVPWYDRQSLPLYNISDPMHSSTLPVITFPSTSPGWYRGEVVWCHVLYTCALYGGVLKGLM